MRTIRPYELFSLLNGNRTASVQVPAHRGAGTLTLLETFCLIAAMKAVNARRVFEFGTFLGATTLNLALNVPEDGRVFTFDLDPGSAASLAQHPSDAPLTVASLAAKRDYCGHPATRRITELVGNSRFFDPEPFRSSMDLIFIDGGHDLPTLAADTSSAEVMLAPSGVIAWHDYGNPDYPELTAFLDDRNGAFGVEDTMLAFHHLGSNSTTAPCR